MYVPELVFGHLLTGSNFNDDDKKVTGGRNGFGAKLTNIYSKKFTVETCDAGRKKKFKNTWTDNMSEKGEAVITSSTKNLTKISFTPDYDRFNMPDGLDADTVALLKKRVHDIAGTTSGYGVKVYLDGDKLQIKNFGDYVKLYSRVDDMGEAAFQPVKSTGSGERWEIYVGSASGQGMEQVRGRWRGAPVGRGVKQMGARVSAMGKNIGRGGAGGRTTVNYD